MACMLTTHIHRFNWSGGCPSGRIFGATTKPCYAMTLLVFGVWFILGLVFTPTWIYVHVSGYFRWKINTTLNATERYTGNTPICCCEHDDEICNTNSMIASLDERLFSHTRTEKNMNKNQNKHEITRRHFWALRITKHTHIAIHWRSTN